MVIATRSELVEIQVGTEQVEGMLELPSNPVGIVLFAHGSGSSRLSPRNNYVADELRKARLGTLLMDLLTPNEDRDYRRRFDIPLLTQRLNAAIGWIQQYDSTASLPIGLFGASTGAAAALQVAAVHDDDIAAVVSRGGRPDLAGTEALAKVRVPTLLIVGGLDDEVITLNRSAYDILNCEKRLEIVPGATHLFEEHGTLEMVAKLATGWLGHYLAMPP
ncbi:MAG: dienelactone hydrolase family protein [Burkholderiaceae bacterium]